MPLVAGLAWTRWADAIKAASDATAWLTSTRADVVELRNGGATARARPVGARRRERHLPRRRHRASLCWRSRSSSLPSSGASFGSGRGSRSRSRDRSSCSSTSYYVHDYYSTAVTASVAALVGVGFAALAAMRSAAARRRPGRRGRASRSAGWVAQRHVLDADVRDRPRPRRCPAARRPDQPRDDARPVRRDHRPRLVTVGPVLRQPMGLDDQSALGTGPRRGPAGAGICRLQLPVHRRERPLRQDRGALTAPGGCAPRLVRGREPDQLRTATNIDAPDGRSTTAGLGDVRLLEPAQVLIAA